MLLLACSLLPGKYVSHSSELAHSNRSLQPFGERLYLSSTSLRPVTLTAATEHIDWLLRSATTVFTSAVILSAVTSPSAIARLMLR